MQPIQISVSVNVGLNDNVVTLLSSLLNRAAAPAPQEAAPKPRKQPTPKPQPVEQKPAKEQAADLKPEETPEETPAEQQAPAEEKPTPTAAAEKEYTVVDVRAAMDRTRKRIEGEDYKENTTSELYQKWHRRLTEWFKQTSAVFGAEKPSALTGSENMGKFIAWCDALSVEGDEFSEDLPF